MCTKTRVFVALLITIMLPILLLPLLDATDSVVMRADNEAATQYSIRIPSAGVDASLVLVHDNCTCCYLGLWNGGRIIADAHMFESVKVDDWAKIYQPEGNLVLECVEIVDCLAIGNLLLTPKGIIQENGDVLLCVDTGWGPIKRVYRWTVL